MLKSFQSIIIAESATVKEAMKQLDASAEKILFVVDNDQKLIGSLSDGDVRRWILSGGQISSNVTMACFKDTFYVEKNFDIIETKKEILKRKIVYVPVVDNKKRIEEFLIWDRLFHGQITRRAKSNIQLPVVIMAGGLGTRLDPFTKILPKPLIPLGDKTAIERIIDGFANFGIDKFYISINHKSRIIKSYFEDINIPYNIEFIQEEKPLGTAGSLKYLIDKINETFIVTNCDIIMNIDFRDVLEYHKHNKNEITLIASMKNFNVPYGVCEIENGGSLKVIREKPEFSFLVNTGLYLLECSVLELLKKYEHMDMTTFIDLVKQNNGKVGVYPISENSWVDTGEWDEYNKALARLKYDL